MRNKRLISFVALLVMACTAGAADKMVDSRRAQTLELYSAAPAVFIENVGQISDSTVRYVFRGSGANIFHTTKGPVFQLFKQENTGQDSKNYRDHSAGYRGLGRHDKKDIIRRANSLSMRFIGAGGVRPIGRGKQETKVNYFIGSDPNKWHKDVATYSEVVYPELYEGISLHTFGRRSHLKYEFHIAAGADYRQIAIKYEGVEGMRIDSNGVLHINTPLGEMVDKVPYIYQIINGKQVQLPGHYRLIDENSYDFEITGKIDQTTELVIDPQLVWVSFMGGKGDESAYGIAVNMYGYSYVTGQTYSDNFASGGAGRAYPDAFVASIYPDGVRGWTTYLGGDGDDCGYGVDLLETGEMTRDYIFVTGVTTSDDLPLTSNGFQSCNNGGIDAFVARLYSNGALDWSSYLGGGGNDVGCDIAVVHVEDVVDSNIIMLTGATGSAPTTSPCTFPNCSENHNGDEYNTGTSDCFVAKMTLGLDNNPELIWYHYIGGDGNDIGYSIAIDDFDFSSIVLGASDSTTGFQMTNYFQGSNSGGLDAFVAQLNTDWSEGTHHNIAWSSFLGGSEDDEGYGVDAGVNQWGRYAFLTGYTKSDDFPQVPEGYCCGSDVFVAKVRYTSGPDEPIGSAHLDWVERVAGSSNERACDITTDMDNEGTTYGILTGWTRSYDFPTTGPFKDRHSGGADAFLARVNENLSGDDASLDWAGYLGGGADDKAYGIDTCIDSEGNRYAVVVGETNSVDWDIEYNGSKDIFAAKVRIEGIIGQGKLYGTVWKTDGTPISGAEVNVPGQQTSTDGDGNFSFNSEDANSETSDILTGRVPVMVKKDPDYYPSMKIVRIDTNSTTHVNIVMAPLGEDSDKPVVVALNAYFCGPGKFAYYMDGPLFYEKFTTTVDWPLSCDPNRVEWRIKDKDGNIRKTDITDCSGTASLSLANSSTHSWCFDMGSDFGVGGTLEVVAVGIDKVSGNHVNSVPRATDFFEVIAPPPYVVDANEDVVVLVNGDGFEYKMLVPGFDMATWSRGNGIPFFKGEMMNVGVHPAQQPAGPRIIGLVYSDGTSDVFAEGVDSSSKKQANVGVQFEGGIELPKLPRGIEAEVQVTAQFAYTYDNPPGNWTPGGGLDVACVFSFSSPYYYVGVIGPVPIYSAAEVSLALGLSSSLEGWGDMGPTLSSSFYFEPLLKGILAAGIADVACVEGYLGGGFHAEVELYPELKWGGQYIILVGGVDVCIGSFTVGGGDLRYSWWPNPGDIKIIHERGFGPVGTEYHDPGVSADLGINEDIVEPNEFPYCVPKIVRLEDGGITDTLLMVWLHDDRSRSSINDRTELRYAIYQNGNWQKPEPGVVVDDQTADMNPQLVSLGSGRAACIWQNAKSTLADCDNLQTLNSNLEVTLATFNAGVWTQEWSTNNTSLDRSPKLAGDADKMLSVWIDNIDCNMWGDGSQQNKIMSKTYYNNSWQVTEEMYQCGMILGTALAYNSSAEKWTYVFCKDGDNDISSPNDQDLWIAWYSAGVGWMGPVPLTTDTDISNTAPRLVYNPGIDELLLFWIRGDEVRMVEESRFVGGFDPNTDSGTVPSPNGLKDFEVVIGQQGQIALIWSSVAVPIGFPKSNPNLFNPECTEPGYIQNDPEHYDPDRLPVYMNPQCVDPNLFLVSHDMWISYRDSCYGPWSMPRQLTWDDAAERSMSGAFESDGRLICVYNKRQTEYNTVDCNYTDCGCNEPNHHPVSVVNVPNPGRRSDLVYLNDDLRADLSIEVEDVKVLPPNPMPGTWAKVSANVKNLGISPASNFTIVFSDSGVPFATVFVSQEYAKGDLDLDGDVDVRDVGIFIDRWLELGCGSGNKWCQGVDIDKNAVIDFNDFGGLANNWCISEKPQILVGGSEMEVSANWLVPEINLSRIISVQVIPDDIRDDSNNNTVSFEVLAPDLIISRMDTYIAGPNSIVKVRVANKGVLPVYDTNNRIKVLLMPDIPENPPLQEKVIRCIEPMSYHDVQFILEVNRPCMVHAVVDPNNVFEEFNEDNNFRAVRIR